MDVVFYTHSKRQNSLKLPSGGDTVSCVLKDNTSLIAPELELKCNTSPKWNYCYISEFSRYYYISDWQYDRGVWTAVLSVDVLTSWQSNILNTTAFIEYSSSNYSLDYIDNRVVSTNAKEVEREVISSELSVFNATGCYILSVISTDANGDNGACAVYALTQPLLKQFSSTITSQSFFDGLWESLKNTFANPFDAIVSCRWIPFSYESLSGTETMIKVMYVETGVLGKLLTSNFKGQNVTMNMPRAGNNPSFLDSGTFTTATLYLPFVGIVPLDIDAYYKSDTFSISMDCDVVTGDIVYTIGTSFTDFTSTYAGNCSTTVPLSNNSMDAFATTAGTAGVIGGLVSTAITVATKKPVKAKALARRTKSIQTGLLTAGASALATIRSAEVHTHTNGAISSRIGSRISLTFELVTIRSTVLDEIQSSDRIARLGLPCYQTLKLSTLTGFCKCSGACVTAPATDSELEEIDETLNSGIYIE